MTILEGDRLKILQIADDFHSGGGKERFIYDLTEKLINKGVKTSLICIDHDNTSSWGDELNCEIINFSSAWLSYIEDYNPDAIIWHVGVETTDKITKIVSKYNVLSIVHNATCPSGTRLFRDNDQICQAATGNMCMVNWYVRKCGTNKSPKEAYRLFNKSKEVHVILNKCKTVYVATKAMQKTLEIENIKSEKIKLFDITLGNLTDLGPIKVTNNTDVLKVLYVGRLSYNKGVQYLIEAISKMKQDNINVMCNIVGGGWYEEELKALVKKKGLDNYINFIGRVNGYEVSEYYLETDVVVVPSIWYEAAGLVVPEARGTGKPVVVFNSGGLQEWQVMMNNIYYAERTDSKSLANKIMEAKQGMEHIHQENQFKSPYKDLCRDMIEDIGNYAI